MLKMRIILSMDRRDLRYLWKRLRPIKPWYFLAIALVSGVICVIALRQNNLHMAALRQQVYDADKNNGQVVNALQNLQAYVTTHMNTNLSTGPNAPYPPIQLQYTYERAVEAAGNAASSANAQVYTDAQHYCEQLDPTDFSGHNRVPCVQQYIQNHGITLPVISDSLYKFAFLSPSWSPDLAGWTLLITIVSFLLFSGFWLTEYWLHRRSQA